MKINNYRLPVIVTVRKHLNTRNFNMGEDKLLSNVIVKYYCFVNGGSKWLGSRTLRTGMHV